MTATAAVLYGGPSTEHDVSILTGLQAQRVLTEIVGEEVLSIYWTKGGDFYAVSTDLEAEAFVNGVPPKSRKLELVMGADSGFVVKKAIGRAKPILIDVLVNCCHGGAGEDGRLQGILDLARIPYTGPTASQASLGMDKMAFGSFANSLSLPTLPRVLVSSDVGGTPPFPSPWIVKPRFGGSSIGIEIVDEPETLARLAMSSPHFRSGAIVEPFLPDAADLNVSVRGHGAIAVSQIERPLRDETGGIYTYKDKYLTSGEGIVGAPRELPARLEKRVEQEIREIAFKVRAALPVRGVARMDFLLDRQQVWLNEINTIPGALSFYLWRDSGVTYRELMLDLIEEARKSRTYDVVTSGSDGAALLSAESIARKLA